MDSNKVSKQTIALFYELLSSVGYYDLFSNSILLLFLKYLISYGDQLSNIKLNSLKAISLFKRKWDEAKNGNGVLSTNDLKELFLAIDEDNVFEELKLSNYQSAFWELFEFDNIKREILRNLDNIKVEYNEEFLKEFIEFLFDRTYRDVRKTMNSVTSKSMRDLAFKLLKINKNDTVLNCFSGYSSFLLNLEKYNRYIGYELNGDVYFCSKLLAIMMKSKNIEIHNKDFLFEPTDNIAEKVFSDGPLNMRYDSESIKSKEVFKEFDTRDGNLIILYKTLRSIKKDGVGVISTSSKVLVSNNDNYSKLRKEFLDSGLAAVIMLPPIIPGTMINANLIVVKEGYKGDICFIDAQNIGVRDKPNNYILLEKDIEKIVKTIDNKTNEDGFSKNVARNKVAELDSWLASKYIVKNESSEDISIEEIDKELNSLYEEFKKNI